MNSLRESSRRAYRIVRRKLRTLLEGPPRHPEFVRAAHYFADGWPLDMWQVARPRQLAADMRGIAADGFNTVILVVPWRGFQRQQPSVSYDEFYLRQLHRVLAAAEKAGLSVIVRVAYSHHLLQDNTPNGIALAQRLLLDGGVQNAWLDCLAQLYRLCRCYRCFREGFLSWEEFWHAFDKWRLADLPERRELAATTGFTDYLASLDPAPEPVDAIPGVGERAEEHYHAFANRRIRDMFLLARDAFAGLAMEIRVDKDPLSTESGTRWLRNDDYTGMAGGRYSYWAPFMGAENRGEQLDAGQAAHLLEHMLQQVTHRGRHTRHVIDQFNFVDDAPKFRGVHAQIRTDQVAPFLELAAPLLSALSRGYGVWAYRDYRQNLLYNPRFLMGLRGWDITGGAGKSLRGGGVRLSGGARLRQYLPPVVAGLQRAVSFDSLDFGMELAGRPSPPAHLRLRINAGPWCEITGESEQALRASVAVDNGQVLDNGLVLELENRGAPLSIATLYLYHYIFRGGIRDEYGKPSLHHAAVVEFNRVLSAGLANRGGED